MQQIFKQAKELAEASNKILLTMHERMDGDDGGSLLAMGIHLEKMKKTVFYTIKKGVPSDLKFLPGAHKIKEEIKNEAFDLLIIFGCSTLDRTGNENVLNLKSKIINIDHHPDNKMFGDVNIVDAKKSSVAEIVYDFFCFNKWEIDKNIAICLLTGIITDTGRFMHSNTQESTLKAAGELMRKGANIQKIMDNIYKNKNPLVLKAWGKALSNLHFDPKHKLIYAIITEQEFEELSALPHNAFEGLAEILNTYPEAKLAMFLRQDGNIIKGSLRTEPFKNIDVSEIAKRFGGGGHKMAAGFSVTGKLIKDERGRWRVI